MDSSISFLFQLIPRKIDFMAINGEFASFTLENGELNAARVKSSNGRSFETFSWLYVVTSQLEDSF